MITPLFFRRLPQSFARLVVTHVMTSTVRVTYHSVVHVVSLPVNATVRDLGVVLETATGASIPTQKILGLKKATNVKAGTLCPARDDDAVLVVSEITGLCDSSKPLMLMGTPKAAIDAMDTAAGVDHRVRGFEEEALRERRRRKGHVSRVGHTGSNKHRDDPGPPSTSRHPYTFTTYKPLPVPSVIKPPASAALRMLQRLARDPGILGIMEKHKWRVPLLAEMPPEGKVGVSESCVLGYNVNAGQEIHLRLRTDDVKGFRRYQRVRETLIHELTHNVFGPHDASFKNLCSQLTRECNEFDWTAKGNGAKRLGDVDTYMSSDEETWSEDEAMAATKGSSGSALGGDDPNVLLDPKLAAGRAAAKREAEVAEREMAGLAREAISRVVAVACACGSCGANAMECGVCE